MSTSTAEIEHRALCPLLATKVMVAWFTAQTRGVIPILCQCQDQRLQSRQRPLEQPYQLVDEASGKTHTVRISNINFAGCVIQQLQPDLALNEHCQQLYLELPEAGGRFHVRILERDRQQLRCLIVQRQLKQADQLLTYLREHILMIRSEPSALDSQLA